MGALEGRDELGVQEGRLEVLELGRDLTRRAEVLGSMSASVEDGRAACRRQTRTGSWSMAQGMRHGMSVLSPKI